MISFNRAEILPQKTVVWGVKEREGVSWCFKTGKRGWRSVFQDRRNLSFIKRLGPLQQIMHFLLLCEHLLLAQMVLLKLLMPLLPLLLQLLPPLHLLLKLLYLCASRLMLLPLLKKLGLKLLRLQRQGGLAPRTGHATLQHGQDLRLHLGINLLKRRRHGKAQLTLQLVPGPLSLLRHLWAEREKEKENIKPSE